ncbi:MAG: hypothetical protein WD055_05260 [Candidatus Dependentiae bacterium]
MMSYIIPVNCNKQFDVQKHLNRIKHKIVMNFPEQWQKKGEIYFWPFVGVCTVLICAVSISCCVRRDTQDSREIFTDMLNKIFGQDIPADMKLNNGEHWANLHVLFDRSGATLHLGKEDHQLCAQMLNLPLGSPLNPDVASIVNFAMSRLGKTS